MAIGSPFFSVIVPAYNSEQYITHGLASITSQTFRNYELIVVCDSCQDRTADIAQSYGANVVNVRYGKDGLTRDKGIELATGKWVLFMDDDDWFLHEHCFSQLYQTCMATDADVIGYGYIWKSKGYIQPTEENFFRWAHVWAKCWRRSVIGNARFGNAQFCSDTWFIKHVQPNLRKIALWDMPIYYYNFMREGSQSHQLANGQMYIGHWANLERRTHDEQTD